MKVTEKIILGVVLLLSLIMNLPGIISGLICGVMILGIGKLTKDKKITKLGWNILIAQDQVGNAATGGDPDETISSRTGKLMSKRHWAKHLAAFLELFERDHAEKSIESDEGDDSIVE